MWASTRQIYVQTKSAFAKAADPEPPGNLFWRNTGERISVFEQRIVLILQVQLHESSTTALLSVFSPRIYACPFSDTGEGLTPALSRPHPPTPPTSNSSNSAGEQNIPRLQQEEDATAERRGAFWQGCMGNVWKLQYRMGGSHR